MFLKRPQFGAAPSPAEPKKSNAGVWAAVIGGIAAIGGGAALAASAGKRPAALKGSGRARRPVGGGCGCGR